ncbi:hypothetical protein PSN45_000821 [Yamadazyma tenuis]|uniref:uncharacterized protein n=1 Tax=Candida tenuis TaxID=2315449 RepID=UPI00279D5515|nr:hypothetical protein PSN45_000821 [Yamadazyma tenuis]
MKLAEALRIRMDYSKKIALVKGRIKECVKVQEGDDSPENPYDLLDELHILDFKLTKLIAEINLVNSEVLVELPSFLEEDCFDEGSYNPGFKYDEMMVEEGEVKPAKKTLCEALSERESLKRRIELMQFTISAGSVANNFNYSKSEIKIICLINPIKLQKVMNKLSEHSRIIDTKIQELNWEVDFEDVLETIIKRKRAESRKSPEA